MSGTGHSVSSAVEKQAAGWLGYNFVLLLGRAIWYYLPKLQIPISFDPVILFLRIYSIGKLSHM